MSKIFTRPFRVRYSELDATGNVAPASYLRYLVETAYDWGAALGLGAHNDRALGLFWLIRETEIHFEQPLRYDDEIFFTIWMINWQRVRGTRCFEITRQSDKGVAAYGTQHIVCMDINTGRPTGPPEDILDNFRLEAPRTFPFERFPKIAAPEKAFVTQRQVEWGDLDALEHVNNAMYVTFAEEAAALEGADRGWPPVKLAENRLAIATRRVHIQYLSPAVWGETLNIATHPLSLSDTGGSRYVGMTRADGSSVCECILDWQLVDRDTGEPRSLPDALKS